MMSRREMQHLDLNFREKRDKMVRRLKDIVIKFMWETLVVQIVKCIKNS